LRIFKNSKNQINELLKEKMLVSIIDESP